VIQKSDITMESRLLVDKCTERM